MFNFDSKSLILKSKPSHGELELIRNIYGVVAAILGVLFIYIFFSFNILNIWSWEVGFIDSTSAFSESLVRLYNFIWSFLFLILTLVLILMGRIIYLFNWNLNLEKNIFINLFLQFIFNLFLDFSALVSDKKLIKTNLVKLNQLSIGISKNINNFYNENKKEFSKIYDLSEYKQLEFIWCILPAVVLCFMAGPSFSLVFSLDSSVNPFLNIKIVGKQWYWVYSFDNIFYDLNGNKEKKNISFIYDSVMINEEDLKKGSHRLLEVDNRLLIPVGVPIRFLITSTDVLHSWAIPSLGLKVDAVPGRLNQFISEIKKPGVFYGQCSELCGPMHGFMPIILQSIDLNEYKNWLNKI